MNRVQSKCVESEAVMKLKRILRLAFSGPETFSDTTEGNVEANAHLILSTNT